MDYQLNIIQQPDDRIKWIKHYKTFVAVCADAQWYIENDYDIEIIIKKD